MNLTNRPVYQKGQLLKKASNNPTTADRLRWGQIAALGCIVGPRGCYGRITIQHCGTGMGRRKDHKKVIPLCWGHHLGREGIDGKNISKPEWESKYGTETLLLRKLERLLRKQL